MKQPNEIIDQGTVGTAIENPFTKQPDFFSNSKFFLSEFLTFHPGIVELAFGIFMANMFYSK